MVSAVVRIAQASGSLAHYFDDYSLLSLSVELGIENPLPSDEVKATSGNWNNHLVVNKQCFQVRVAIVFAGVMMFVILAEWSQVLQPLVNIFDQPRFIIVDVDPRSNVHS